MAEIPDKQVNLYAIIGAKQVENEVLRDHAEDLKTIIATLEAALQSKNQEVDVLGKKLAEVTTAIAQAEEAAEEAGPIERVRQRKKTEP